MAPTQSLHNNCRAHQQRQHGHDANRNIIEAMNVKKLSAVFGYWLHKRIRQLGAWLVLGASACVPNLQALNLPESTNKLMYARELNRIYIDPMGMHGKPASYALATLLGEGFRCDLRLVSPIGLDEPPLTDCFKSPSDFRLQCPDLYITVRFVRQPEISSREELINRLDKVMVKNAMAFCPYPDKVSAEFIAARDAAQAILDQQVKALALPSNGLAAYEKLLMQDYYCGFEANGAEEGNMRAAQMVCTRWRTRIRYCHEARLAMDMDWPSEITSFKQLYGALAQAQVKAVSSSCEIPSAPKGGR